MEPKTIIPTLFATNIDDLKKEYYSLSSLFSHFHIDIGDGNFVPVITPSLEDLSFLKHENKTFEVHLMCYNPLEYIHLCKSFGNITRILIHYEAFSSYKECFEALETIESQGFLAGIVVNPDTQFETIIPFANHIDVLMFMSVYPGKQGQEFIINTYQKIKRAHDLNKKIRIQTDGGVKDTQIRRLVHNGATHYCIGSYLNEANNPSANLEVLQIEEKRGIEEQKHIIHISKPYSQITSYIFLGPNKCCQGVSFDQELLDIGIRAEINLEEFELTTGYGIQHYLWLPTVDHQAPSQKQLLSGVQFIDSLVKENVKIYIHCELGHTRSPTLVIAYFIYKGYTFKDAKMLVEEKRPSIHITQPQETSLKHFEKYINN